MAGVVEGWVANTRPAASGGAAKEVCLCKSYLGTIQSSAMGLRAPEGRPDDDAAMRRLSLRAWGACGRLAGLEACRLILACT